MVEKRNKGKETAVSGSDESLEARFAVLEEMVTEQNKMVADQNKKMETNLADMFEAIRLLSVTKAASGEAIKEDRSPASNVPTSDLSFLNPGGEKSGKSGTGNTYSALTRLAKVDFPRFDGDKIKEWLFKVEEFFKLDKTLDDVKVKLAAIHFDGQASAWHQYMEESEQFKHLLDEWITYKLVLKERFEDVFEDPVAELKQLQETDGIVAYQAKFEVIRTRINLPEDYLVRTYLAGLRTDTQMHIRMFNPQTVRQCFMLGRLYEKAHPEKQYTVSGPVSRSSSFDTAGKGILPVPKEGGTKLQAVNKAPSKPTSPTGKKYLSQEEMSERRAKGLCFLCDEKFTPEHYLQHKKTQVFMIEVEDESEKGSEDAEQDTDEVIKPMPKISLNAVSGISDNNTMRVRGTYNKRNLFILIDSGSTHNFMDPKVAEKLGCVVKSAGLMKVSVADGNKLGVQGLIEVFKWQFQSVEFETSLMLIPLGGCDMVLGIQWLKTLGPITWDFDKLEMGFKVDKQKVLLHGVKHGSVREVKAQKINKLQEENIQVAMICVQKLQEEEEEDAGGGGSGAVLMQDSHPIAYISRQLKGTQLHLSIYEKELLDVVFAVQKWRHYLLPKHFIIKKDQRSLKYLLEQRLNTPIQQQWLPKLLEFDYEVQYKQGKRNLVAEALSRVDGSEILHMALTVVEYGLLKEIQECYERDDAVKVLSNNLQQNQSAKKHCTGAQNVLRRKNKMVVPNDTTIKDTMIKEPELILERKMIRHQGQAATKVLVKWTNEPVEEATWEVSSSLQKRFQQLNLVVKVLEEGRFDTD